MSPRLLPAVCARTIRRAVLATLAAAIVSASASAAAAPRPAALPPSIPACGPERVAGGALPSAVPWLRGDAGAPPPITARAAAVVDAETGRVLLDHRAHERRAPASTTKIMTAVLALEEVPGDQWTYSQTDASQMVHSSVMGLRPGVYIRMRDLIYGLMLPSGNDAAIEIAMNVDGGVAPFVDRMNAKVRELGLQDTHFTNPHGLDHGSHFSSAYDLAMIGRYAMANEEFRRVAATRAHHLEPPSDYDIYNGNSLLDAYPGADGIKIGWTDHAGWTLVASAVRDGRRVFVTVLDSADRDADAAALLDWAFESHEWKPVSERTQRQLRLASRLGLGDGLRQTLGVCG
jgi:D-alanyl-D-alanine carboxypeptidase